MEHQSSVLAFDIKQQTATPLSLQELVIDPQNNEKIYWIHLDLNQQNDFSYLVKKLNLPDFFEKLCNKNESMPVLLDTAQSVSIRIQSLLTTTISPDEKIDSSTLLLHLTPHYCLTASFDAMPAIETLIELYPKALQYAKTPCFILFLVLDTVINHYSSLLYDFELLTDAIDLDIRGSHEQIKQIFDHVMQIKKTIIEIKRYTVAIRDILMRISGRNIAVISDPCRISLTNLFNHGQMLVNECDSIRDIINGMLEQIDNALMQNLSETMRILTGFASIFLPVTLIPCIYGMNFKWMPELQWEYGYFYALILMLFCGVGLWALFKKLKWF